ncbi:glycogen debranching protein [Klebsiella pneumoniae]|uniref:Glycogen debranching protein n=1 Tax=Klebsiella pneumoniae TaxID=573 RepID=A0A2X3CWD8_KLEPN|nr:glycogen debranching protein [Klebsiella pneumoniae]
MGGTVIYEAHVKGLTLLNPQLPEAIRGTYKALGHPAMIAYFKSLGISALELLPVAQFASEPRLQRMGLSNYWGYNPLAWFALDPRLPPATRIAPWMSFAMRLRRCTPPVSK